MSSSLLNRLRSCITVCVLSAFLHGQTSWGAERLIPGVLPAQAQQPATPGQPTEGQQQPGQTAQPQTQQQPTTETTVVEVPIPKEGSLDITVVEGEGATNIVGKKSSSRVVVEVRDEKAQLLEGAVVTFIAPADGPSVLFNNGMRTITVMTDGSGRAHTPTMRAVNTGTFRMQVSASFRGQMVSTTVSVNNYNSSAEAKEGGTPADSADRPAANKKSGGGGISGTTWAIILGAGGAAAVGIALGLGHKGSGTTAANTSATIGGAGGTTVGAP